MRQHGRSPAVVASPFASFCACSSIRSRAGPITCCSNCVGLLLSPMAAPDRHRRQRDHQRVLLHRALEPSRRALCLFVYLLLRLRA